MRSLRNFFISLIISAILFSLVGYNASLILVECLGPMFGVTDYTQNNNQEQEDDVNNGQSNVDDSKKAESFCILLVTTNYKPSAASEYNAYDVAIYPHNEKDVTLSVDSIGTKKINATDFVILRGNTAKNEYTYTYIPATTTLTVKGTDMTLNEIYRSLGITFTANKISAITGFKFDYYSIYDIEDVSYIVDYIGGINYTVLNEIKNGEEIILSPGNYTIKGNEVTTLLDYQDYGSESQRGQMLISLIRSILSKITNKIYQIDIVALHRSSNNKVDSTLTIASINSISELLYSYNTTNVIEITYPGTYKSVDGVTKFMPNISSAISKFSKYR